VVGHLFTQLEAREPRGLLELPLLLEPFETRRLELARLW
jgi:hypothetical protein